MKMKIVFLSCVAIVALSAMSPARVVHRPSHPWILAEFHASALKWILIAEPEFEKVKIDVDKYYLSVNELQDGTVAVMLSEWAFDDPRAKNVRGNRGILIGYEVLIRKSDRKIIRAAYTG